MSKRDQTGGANEFGDDFDDDLEDDGFGDDFDDDFEDALVELTSKPTSVTPATPSAPAAATAPSRSVEDEILMTKGENAILRQQIQELVQRHNKEQKRLRESYDKELGDKTSKVKAYVDAIKRVEDEKKFLDSEVKNLSLRLDLEGSKRKRPKTGNTTELRADKVSESQMSESPFSLRGRAIPAPSQKLSVIGQRTVIPLEKDLFIDAIMAHVIPGSSRSTMDFLSRIDSEVEFSRGPFKITKGRESIKTELTNYLVSIKNDERLDTLISEFLLYLLEFCNKLFSAKSLLPIPFLQALMHCAMRYRPVAVPIKTLWVVLNFNVEVCTSYPNLLRGTEDPFEVDKPALTTSTTMEEVKVFVKHKPFQNVVLEIMVTTFALDLVETATEFAKFRKVDDLKGFYTDFLLEILSLVTHQQTPTNYVFNAVEILTNAVVPEVFGTSQSDATADAITEKMMLLTKLLASGMESKSGLRVYGLNRIVGCGRDIKLLEALVPLGDDPMIAYANVSLALPLSPDMYNDIIKNNGAPLNTVNQELHRLHIRHEVLRMFELYFSRRDIVPLKPETMIEIARVSIWLLVKQQEYILRSPRSRTVHTRIKVVNSIVRVVHHICTESALEISQLPRDVLRDVVTAFLAICATTVSHESAAFVAQARKVGYMHPIFNAHLERKNEEVFGIASRLRAVSLDDYLRDAYIIEEHTKADTQSNGVEISYDDTTIELARDVLGLCVTGDEADSLYFSMNWVDPQADIGFEDDDEE
ncbi:unnamed protein product [Kuraishia capsulata CBS 1993]|uniref:DNA damage checkpoint protein LCD1 n=1 Tax=Kuraishia capsulata CBS 1993 TaxID=1382522 RepID=W6MLB0_9ASCO|nr:uncharacterized protein KUCA_T00002868001 [Kuraishia capsulata CBS 1993]CDK26893.1 unnamed protein product [Kuraishia capsulata CBS 1993]